MQPFLHPKENLPNKSLRTGGAAQQNTLQCEAMMTVSASATTPPKPSKQADQAKALRANLLRRKAAAQTPPPAQEKSGA